MGKQYTKKIMNIFFCILFGIAATLCLLKIYTSPTDCISKQGV